MTQTANRSEAAPIYLREPYGYRWWMIALLHAPLTGPWFVLPVYPWLTWMADGARNTDDPLGILLGFEGIFVGTAVALAFFQAKDWSSLRQRTIAAAEKEVQREDTVFIMLVFLIWGSAGLVLLAFVSAHVKDNSFYWALVPLFGMLHLVISGSLIVLRQSGAEEAAEVYKRIVRLARIHALNPSLPSPPPQSQQNPPGLWQQFKQVWLRWRPWSTQMTLAAVFLTTAVFLPNVAEHTWALALGLLALAITMVLACFFSAPLMAYGKLTGDPIVMLAFISDAVLIITLLTRFVNSTANAQVGQRVAILILFAMLLLDIALKVRHWPGRARKKWTERRAQVLELAATQVASEGRTRVHSLESPADARRAIQEVCDEAPQEGREELRSYLLGALDIDAVVPENDGSDCPPPRCMRTRPSRKTPKSGRCGLTTGLILVALLAHIIWRRRSDRG